MAGRLLLSGRVGLVSAAVLLLCLVGGSGATETLVAPCGAIPAAERAEMRALVGYAQTCVDAPVPLVPMAVEGNVPRAPEVPPLLATRSVRAPVARPGSRLPGAPPPPPPRHGG